MGSIVTISHPIVLGSRLATKKMSCKWSPWMKATVIQDRCGKQRWFNGCAQGLRENVEMHHSTAVRVIIMTTMMTNRTTMIPMTLNVPCSETRDYMVDRVSVGPTLFTIMR